MIDNIAAVACFRVIGTGSRRIIETGLDEDIGRFGKVKMNIGSIDEIVMANRAIGRVPAL
jgi:hypothetical protein